jgi:hypothetical protein
MVELTIVVIGALVFAVSALLTRAWYAAWRWAAAWWMCLTRAAPIPALLHVPADLPLYSRRLLASSRST